MTTKTKKAPSLGPSARGIRHIRAEAIKLLVEETKAPKGKFYGLKVDPHASFETIESLLRFAGRASDLIKVRVGAARKYGDEVL